MPEGVGYASSNVVASAGLELNYVGNHVYAFSGTFASATSAFTMLDFTTGAKTIKGLFAFNGQIRFDSSVSAGGYSGYQVSFNGIIVALAKTDTTNNDMPIKGWEKVIIPPYTNVKVEGVSGEATATELMTVVFTGKTL